MRRKSDEGPVGGHKGYIGAVAAPILQAAGHTVIGLDSDLFAGCDFGTRPAEIGELRGTSATF